MAGVSHISIDSRHKGLSSSREKIFSSLKEGLEHVMRQEPDESALGETLLEEWLEKNIMLPKPTIFHDNIITSIGKISYRINRQGELLFLEADYPINYSGMQDNGPIESIAVHHTGNGNNLSVPSILLIHASYNNWDAIGYHYLINKDGIIIKTRPEKYEGAHITGQNKGKIAIAFSTNQNNEQPSKEMLKSYNGLKAFLDKEFGIRPENDYGHIQYSIKRINQELEQSGLGLELLSEEEFLSIRKVEDFSHLKKKHLAEVESKKSHYHHDKILEKTYELLKSLRACPGIRFYPHL